MNHQEQVSARLPRFALTLPETQSPRLHSGWPYFILVLAALFSSLTVHNARYRTQSDRLATQIASTR